MVNVSPEKQNGAKVTQFLCLNQYMKKISTPLNVYFNFERNTLRDSRYAYHLLSLKFSGYSLLYPSLVFNYIHKRNVLRLRYFPVVPR